jgi:hypothetical protein
LGVPLLSYGPVVTANDHRVQPGLDSLAAGYVPARLPYQVHAIPTRLDPQAWGGLRRRRASWRSGSPRHRRKGPATSGSPPRGVSPSRISTATSQKLEQRKAADATRELAGLRERRERLSELDRLAETVEEYLGDLPQLVRGGQTSTAKEDRAERCRWAYWLLGLRVVAYKDGTLEV